MADSPHEGTIPREKVTHYNEEKVEMNSTSQKNVIFFNLLDTLAELASKEEPKSITDPPSEVKIIIPIVAPSSSAGRSLRRPRAMSEPWGGDDSHAVSQLTALSNISGRNIFTPLSSPSKPSFEGTDRTKTENSMLSQYSTVYNKGGRIGIYTREEREAIIKRFHERRKRRVWRKKIRYHCRKNLADRRVRIKGRFVKAGMHAEELEEVVVDRESDPPQVASETADDSDGGYLLPPGKRMRRHSIAY